MPPISSCHMNNFNVGIKGAVRAAAKSGPAIELLRLAPYHGTTTARWRRHIACARISPSTRSNSPR